MSQYKFENTIGGKLCKEFEKEFWNAIELPMETLLVSDVLKSGLDKRQKYFTLDDLIEANFSVDDAEIDPQLEREIRIQRHMERIEKME